MMNQASIQTIRDIINREISNGMTAGVHILVRQNGVDEMNEAFGFADIENQVKLGLTNLYRIFSMTKPITAVAAMILVERGELDLNMPLQDVFPEFASTLAAGPQGLESLERPITVLHLLNMTSGLTYGDAATPEGRQLLAYLNGCQASGQAALTTCEFVRGLAAIPLAFQPDSSWSYGLSADVLGAVIERVAGTRFSAFLRANLFMPLGMTDTDFWAPPEKQRRLAKAYESGPDDKMLPFMQDYLLVSNSMAQPPAFESGGAGLVSTARDYAQFAEMLLNKGAYHQERILSEATVNYLLSGSLTMKQQEAFRRFGGHEGYTYSHFMRHLDDPGQACLISERQEYGWAGWMGCYFANIPGRNATILLMQQKAKSGTTGMARKIRNVLSASQ